MARELADNPEEIAALDKLMDGLLDETDALIDAEPSLAAPSSAESDDPQSVTFTAPEAEYEGVDEAVVAAIAEAIGLTAEGDSAPSTDSSPAPVATEPGQRSGSETDLQAVIQQTIAQQLGPMLQWFQQQQSQQEQVKRETEYESFMERLDEMSPMDAADAKLGIVTEFAANLLREKQQQQQESEFRVQYENTLNFIASGGRGVPGQDGQWQRVDNHAKPLTDHEKHLLSFIKDSPLSMQKAADEMIRQREQQTAAARQALAEKRREAGEGLGLQGGGAGKGAEPKEPTTVDELLDLTDAQGPWAWRNFVNRQRSAHA